MFGLTRSVSRQARLGLRSMSGGHRWDILASVCIERPPYLTPPLPGKVLLSEDTIISIILADMESKTLTLLKQKELEQKITCLNHKQQELEHIESLELRPQLGESQEPSWELISLD